MLNRENVVVLGEGHACTENVINNAQQTCIAQFYGSAPITPTIDGITRCCDRTPFVRLRSVAVLNKLNIELPRSRGYAGFNSVQDTCFLKAHVDVTYGVT